MNTPMFTYTETRTDPSPKELYRARLDAMVVNVMLTYEERGDKTLGDYVEIVTQVAAAHLAAIDAAVDEKFKEEKKA